MCLPMCQEDLPADMDLKRKTDGVYDQAFSGCLNTFAGGLSCLHPPLSFCTSYVPVLRFEKWKADNRIQF
jgi:hypothetical protein